MKRLDFKLQLNNDSFVLRLYPVFYRSNGYLLLGFGAVENHDSRKMKKKKKSDDLRYSAMFLLQIYNSTKTRIIREETRTREMGGKEMR